MRFRPSSLHCQTTVAGISIAVVVVTAVVVVIAVVVVVVVVVAVVVVVVAVVVVGVASMIRRGTQDSGSSSYGIVFSLPLLHCVARPYSVRLRVAGGQKGPANHIKRTADESERQREVRWQ
ncbi:hypothetical protein SAMD00023353_0201440 [Rosellinia necatrix]|uniref:Uncharacterized protein n=1 Tax=Rosellinia necatrix TaxID=77044 RepID=A0A1S8A535_ROSNE|nr:hypothetical protein SAMD00023353_0201440 [Rosellinia necatrix]